MSNKISKLFVFLLSLTIMMVTVGTNYTEIEASTGTYQVKKIESNGNFTNIDKATTDFNAAKAIMDAKPGNDFVITSTGSKSPLKIVAIKTGYAQSYPYRKGTGFGLSDPDATLHIYSNTSASYRSSYVSAHYKMFYHETVLVNKRLLAKISIQGVEGYVDINKTDLIPMFFVNNGKKIELGGSENYYNTPELKQSVLVEHDVYNANNNEMTVNYSRTFNDKNGNIPKHQTTYGQAPSWLKSGVSYYSADGIRFFTDPELTHKVMDGDKPGEYYAYYQWLPVRTMSNLTATDFNNRLEALGYGDSVMHDNEQAFIESGNKYGMNPLLLFAQASLESAYGTSNFAKDRYNLFGWNAVDSNPGLASKYDGVFIAVEKQMSRQLSGYFDEDDWRHEGLSFGNKASGISVRYASDPFYGVKIAGIAYETDKSTGFKDHNSYDLTRVNSDDGEGLTIRKGPGTSFDSWGITKGSIVNDIRTHLGIDKGFVKTNLAMVIKNGAMTESVGPVDLTKEFGYLAEKYAPKLPKNGNGSGKVPTERVIVIDEVDKQLYQTTDALNLRNSWTTDGSKVLTTIPSGTTLAGHMTSNGWVKVIYDKQAGYVHPDYLVNGPNSGTPETPTVPDNSKTGDLNADGKINISDMMVIQRHILGVRKLDEAGIKSADLNNDGKVNISDMMVIQRHILGIKTLN